MREYRTPGSLAGLAGDCQSYATVRRAQLGISSWVQVPGEQGLTSHSYRVLQLKG